MYVGVRWFTMWETQTNCAHMLCKYEHYFVFVSEYRTFTEYLWKVTPFHESLQELVPISSFSPLCSAIVCLLKLDPMT